MRWAWRKLSCITISTNHPSFVFKRIEALTAETLLEVANEMFAEEYLSTLIYR